MSGGHDLSVDRKAKKSKKKKTKVELEEEDPVPEEEAEAEEVLKESAGTVLQAQEMIL